MGHGRMEEDVSIRETSNGRIKAVLNPERPGNVFLQVHPGLRTPELKDEMLVVAEKYLIIPGANGQRRLHVWVNAHDNLRQNILTRHGYLKGDEPEYQRRRPMSMPILDVPIAAGYTVRALGDVEELPARSLVSWKAFHPDEPDDRYEGWDWYHNIQHAPL